MTQPLEAAEPVKVFPNRRRKKSIWIGHKPINPNHPKPAAPLGPHWCQVECRLPANPQPRHSPDRKLYGFVPLHTFSHSCSNIEFYLSISQISFLMTSWPISWWELRGCIFQRMTCGISPSFPLNLLMRDFSLHAPLMSIYGQLPCTSCPLYTLYSSCTLPKNCLAVFDTAVCLTLQCAVCSVVGTMGGHRLWMRDCRPLPYQMPSLHTQCSWPS